jgi:hypothetical protein
MKLFRIFGLWDQDILEKNCKTKGTVTLVQTSFLHVVKKPIRIGINPNNTIFSHFITFTYTIDGVSYKGKRFVDLYYRCPQRGEQIDVFYDPEKPENYACYAFGPNLQLNGW